MAKSQTTKNTSKSGMSTKDYEIKIEDTYLKGFEHGREEMYKNVSKALKEYKKRQKLISEIMRRGGIR